MAGLIPPASLKLPSLTPWDVSSAAVNRSPAPVYAPPDINSEIHDML